MENWAHAIALMAFLRRLDNRSIRVLSFHQTISPRGKLAFLPLFLWERGWGEGFFATLRRPSGVAHPHWPYRWIWSIVNLIRVHLVDSLSR
jgi:hypothetical protein